MEAGYDVPMTDIDPLFQCVICNLVLREPMQTACGHRFCEPCMRRSFVFSKCASNELIICPVDDQVLQVDQIFADHKFRRTILSLMVQCPNTQEGCCWGGELRDLEEHRKLCYMEEVKCPHGCEKMTKRSLLGEHAIVCPSRQVKCEHCQERVIHRDLEKHTDTCPKALETGNCKKDLVDCPYSVFGCCYKAEHSKMEIHRNSNEVLRNHMDLARSCLLKHEQTISELKDTVTSLVQKTEELLPMIQQNQQKNA